MESSPYFGRFYLKSPRTTVILTAATLVCSLSCRSQNPPAQPTMPTASSRAFSPGLKLGDTVYVSGHLGIDPSTGQPPADIGEETRNVMKSVQATLEEGGLTMDDLVYVEVYCTDLSLYGDFNKQYVTFFRKPYPARDFIGVKNLLFGAHFEVMAIARKHASHNKKELSAAR